MHFLFPFLKFKFPHEHVPTSVVIGRPPSRSAVLYPALQAGRLVHPEVVFSDSYPEHPHGLSTRGRRHGVTTRGRHHGLSTRGRHHGLSTRGQHHGLSTRGQHHGVTTRGRHHGVTTRGRHHGLSTRGPSSSCRRV